MLTAKAVAGACAGAVFGLGTALLAAIGVGVGSLIRSQLAWVMGVFAWTIVIEPLPRAPRLWLRLITKASQSEQTVKPS